MSCMTALKKIAVCHGKSCSQKGAHRILRILEEYGAPKGIKITERKCCGRCEHSCTIVANDQPISDLSPENLKKNFLDNPEQAINDAHERDKDAHNALEDLFDVLEE